MCVCVFVCACSRVGGCMLILRPFCVVYFVVCRCSFLFVLFVCVRAFACWWVYVNLATLAWGGGG
jgi:hypothetical protein